VLSEKWQKFFYWNPFYWSYKGNQAILSENAVWSKIFIYTGIIGLISLLVYIILMPKIRTGLSQ
ncbi:MAG: ABC transporter permease, partial [Tissierellia bacterium]|nr:ABC transporter permease [Tissierellia bacterium]